MTPAPFILLVEDDADHAAIFEHVWKQVFPRTLLEIAPDGKAAVDRLSRTRCVDDRPPSSRPAVVVLDLKLPGMSGLDVLEWIRLRPDLKDLPAVLLTTSQESSDKQRAEALGADGYFVKPVGIAEMRKIVKAIGAYLLSLQT